DLKTSTAQRVIRQLVQDSDILVESFRPGTLSRYNLDYPRLRRVNKALVYCSISGFGQTGPYRDRPGYDIVAFAMSGIMSTTGEEARPSVRVSIPVADIAAGHYASTAILACLSRRLVTGRGDYIDISLYDSEIDRNLSRYYRDVSRNKAQHTGTSSSIRTESPQHQSTRSAMLSGIPKSNIGVSSRR